MQFVQPIREKNKINEIKNILKMNSYRDFLLFIAGINTGLRISDLLKLKVSDIKEQDHITIKEQKTGKSSRFFINNSFKKQAEPFIKDKAGNEYLFSSRKGNNQPLTRTQAYRIINDASRKAGIKDKIGTHTLRKTFGYHHYQMNKDVALLQTIFNHSAPSITLRYIGINDDLKDKSMQEFEL